jgi:hypothetical protein
MSGLADLPADERAVLELVLGRGRNYDEIAAMLRIDRAGVRQRALSAFDALAPHADVPPERRGLIADYLLGQLPPRAGETIRARLASDPAEHAWARAVASELAGLASGPLPEIPDAGSAAPAADSEPASSAAHSDGSPAPRRSSRLGGAILLGLGALIVIAVIIVVLVNSGGSSHTGTTTTQAAGTGPATTPTNTGTGTGTTGSPKVVSNTSLAPTDSTSKARGEAEVFSQGGKLYLALVAENLHANSHNYYAVWLSNGGTDTHLLGFAPTVTKNGQLEAATPLQSTYGRFQHLLLTLETTAHPKGPGTVILSGAFKLS